MIPHIYNGNGTISLMLDGVMKPVDTAHKFYEEIKEALKVQNWDAIPDLVNIKKTVEKAIAESSITAGSVTIEHGEVFYDGSVVHSSLANRMVSMAREGFDIAHMVKFLQNLMLNPSFRAVNELYDFLEAGAIPITEKGTFLGYKKITPDWTDIYTKKLDNSVGATVKMNRNQVNEDSSQTCSAGLHICAYSYLSHYGSCADNRVVVCEINPMNVVSIPTDYNNTKMRVCEYTVIGEVKDFKDSDTLAGNTVMYTDDIKSGKQSGTVNHSNAGMNAKEIGKAVTNALRNEVVDGSDIKEMCMFAGLNQEKANTLGVASANGEFKRVGKKIAKYVRNNKMNGSIVMDGITPIDTPVETVTVIKPDGKAIGKAITLALDCKDINGDDVEEFCIAAGLGETDAEEIYDACFNAEYKRAGKKIGRFITNGEMDADVFMNSAADVQFGPVKEAPKAKAFCGRCNTEITGGSQCVECGYYF